MTTVVRRILKGAGRADHDPSAPGSRREDVAGHVSRSIERTIPVFGLLGAQLGHVIETTETAAFALLDDMQAADGAAGNLASEATRLADLTADQGTEIEQITELSRGSREVIDQLVAFLARRDQAVVELVGDVRNLNQNIATIQQIARSTTMLALNARIEAGRAGKHGEAFQVVADEVRDLSRQSDVAANDIRQRIELLADRLGKTMQDQAADPHRVSAQTSPGATQRGEALSDRLNAVAQEQHDMIERLETFNGRVEAASRQMVSSSALVHELTTSMMGGLQFQDVTRQVIEQVVESLDDLGKQFASASEVLVGRGDVDALAELDAAMERMQSGYVMQKQRMIHAKVTGATTTIVDEPVIELF